MAKNPKLIDIVGQTFGDWFVVRQNGNRPGGKALWLCVCVCGASGSITGGDLRAGKSTGCGCRMATTLKMLSTTHGDCKTRMYRIWVQMRTRCRGGNPRTNKHYFDKGIVVCEEWNVYETFRAWALANGYADNLSIDRIDNDKGYSPGNCRWATSEQQANNRSIVHRLADGRPGPMVAKANGIPARTFAERIKDGWTPDEAATHPYGVWRVPDRGRVRNNRGQYS